MVSIRHERDFFTTTPCFPQANYGLIHLETAMVANLNAGRQNGMRIKLLLFARRMPNKTQTCVSNFSPNFQYLVES